MAGMFEISQPGKREFLADFIQNVDKGVNHFLARAKRGRKPTNTLMQWQADNYPAPRTTGVVDGSDASNFEFIGDRQKIYNYVQKWRRAPSTSDMAENVSDVAGLGPNQEMANQIRKSLFMLARDIETTALQYAVDCQADNGNVPYLTRSIGVWGSSTAGTVQPVPTSYLPPSASTNSTATASLAETDVRDVMASQAGQANAPLTLTMIVGPTLKKTISYFQSYAPASTIPLRRTAEAQGELVQAVDMLKNDFGTAEILLSYFVAKDGAYSAVRGYSLDMDMWEISYNRMPRVKELPDLDGGPRAAVTAIAGLVCRNPLTVGRFGATA